MIIMIIPLNPVHMAQQRISDITSQHVARCVNIQSACWNREKKVGQNLKFDILH